MDKQLEQYLETVERHLKKLPTSERVDIVKEIKSTILEMQQEGLTAEEILDRLGDPREMAKEYLGDLIATDHTFGLGKYLRLMAFYSVAGLSGMFVLPVLGILAPVFKACGVVIPIAGAIELVGYLFHYDVPFISMGVGAAQLHPVLGFVLCIVVGIAFYKAGCAMWKVLVEYIQRMSDKRDDLSI